MRRRKEAIFYTLILALCLPFSLTAEEEQTEIAVLIKGMSNPYWKTLNDGVLDKSKELGVKTYLQGVQSDTEAEAQLNLCNTMLLRKPKALIFAAVNGVNLAPCLSQAMQMGIALVDVDGCTGVDDAKKMGIKLNFSVASDNYQLGQKAAEYLGQTKGKVLIIEGFPGSVPGRLRVKGFRENLSKDLNVVASLTGDWDRLKASDITNNITAKHPDLAAIFAANDLMALGAAEALKTKGLGGIKVIGIDGIADAVKAINSERLTASIAQLPYLMGSEAVEKTHKFLRGEATFDFDQKVPIVTLDKNILVKNNEPLLKFVK